ncbi:MAG TPA: hypothetical protein PKM51_10800, partial [Chitinophagales bacterium]|nr:hypothetical protein [Chitinophagales bacterium]
MDELIAGFPQQLERAMQIGEAAKIGKNKFPIRNILISGLGGSGIGGTIIANILRDDIAVPILVNKEYQIPAYVNENTLVVISSYSGNTEETVSCFHEAIAKGLKPVCVSSGGKLRDLALRQGIDFVPMPTGFPPRASLAYGAANLFYILNHFGVLQYNVATAFSQLGAFLQAKQTDIQVTAKHYAVHYKNKI